MLSRFFQSFRRPVPRSSPRRRNFAPGVECLEKRKMLTASASNPTAGVSWTEQIYFHGHYASSHLPTASDFQVTIAWGDGSTTVTKSATELGANSDQFEVTADHTYSTPGNTPGLFEVDIKNLHDNCLSWVQLAHGMTVRANPTPTPDPAAATMIKLGI